MRETSSQRLGSSGASRSGEVGDVTHGPDVAAGESGEDGLRFGET